MSSEIIKSIKIDEKNGKVLVSGCSKNTTPKYFHPYESPSLSEILVKEGKEALIKEFLVMYWGNIWMGTANIYSKAVKLFNIKNSELTYDNIGTIKDVDIVNGPLEDLPKYLNHAGSSYTSQLIKKRLEGHDFGQHFRPKVTMTHDELKDALYQEYLSFKNRKKEKHYICVLDRTLTGNTDKLFCRPSGRRYYTIYDIKSAMIFDSWEEAALMCNRYSIGTLSPLGNYLTSQGNYSIQKLTDYEE